MTKENEAHCAPEGDEEANLVTQGQPMDRSQLRTLKGIAQCLALLRYQARIEGFGAPEEIIAIAEAEVSYHLADAMDLSKSDP